MKNVREIWAVRTLLGGMIGLAYALISIFGIEQAIAASPPLLSTPNVAAKTTWASEYGETPLAFEVNRGQTDERANFLSRGPGYTLYLTQNAGVLSLIDPDGKRHVLRVGLEGARPDAKMAGLNLLTGKSNYFIGSDPKKWHRNIPRYAKVSYAGVYPGIDVIFYGNNQRQLEYDFIVKPGADPGAIQLELSGADKLEIGPQGNLIAHLAGSEVRLLKPIVYQNVDGVRLSVDGRYRLSDGRRVAFEVAAYDASRDLVIDPVLSYYTYLGGSGNENTWDITVDNDGNAYVTGQTPSDDFPTSPISFPYQGGDAEGYHKNDVYVTKLNSDGTDIIYSTYVGGAKYDSSRDIAVDTAGNAYVTGWGHSDDFPQEYALGSGCGLYSDFSMAFVFKLNADGSDLVYSTCLSGTFPGLGIAVDTVGDAYVTGGASSPSFPTTPGAFQTCGYNNDAYVAKLSDADLEGSGLKLVYATCLGGSDFDDGKKIAVDANGNAYIVGGTSSSDFPTTEDAFDRDCDGQGDDFCEGDTRYGRDTFVTKLNSVGSALVYSTYLGGSGIDSGLDIAVDASGNAYVTGGTFSDDFPTTPGAFDTVCDSDDIVACDARAQGYFADAFVTKVNPDGSDLVYSTYLGGGIAGYLGSEVASGIAVDGARNAYVVGNNASATFPEVNPIPIPDEVQNCGQSGNFLTKLDGLGSSVLFSMCMGGSFNKSVAVDRNGSVYVTGDAFYTDLATPGAFQETIAGSGDTFVAKILQPDSDGDGIEDDLDECPNSDMSDTVIVDSCDSGIANTVLSDPVGCTVTDEILWLADDAKSHGQFVSQVDKFLLGLQKDGLLLPKEKSSITDCAAQSDLP